MVFRLNILDFDTSLVGNCYSFSLYSSTQTGLLLPVSSPVGLRRWAHIFLYLDQSTRQESCPILSIPLRKVTTRRRPRNKASFLLHRFLCQCLLEKASPANLSQSLASVEAGPFILTMTTCSWPASILQDTTVTTAAATSRDATTGEMLTTWDTTSMRTPGFLRCLVIMVILMDKVAQQLVYLLLLAASCSQVCMKHQLLAKLADTTWAR